MSDDLLVRPSTDRADAARARGDTMTRDDGDPGLRSRTAPKGLGQARSLAFPAVLRAKPVIRNGQSLIHLSGVASVTDTPYEMWDFFGPYDEIVSSKAFDATLAAEPDVAFLVNHKGVTMARTTNGTLDLAMTASGLGSDAYVNPKRTDVHDLVTAIEDGNIDQMSFAFVLEEGRWSEDFTQFTITRLNINRGDVSAVNYGANPLTSIAARSREILDELDHLPVGFARAAMARLSARPDLAAPLAARGAQSDAPRRGGIPSIEAWIATVEAQAS